MVRAVDNITHQGSIGGIVILLGILLLIIGFVTGVSFVWSLGVIVLVIGLVLWFLGAIGHAVGGRRHYF
jgi:membrane-bound ClpP family serine protease